MCPEAAPRLPCRRDLEIGARSRRQSVRQTNDPPKYMATNSDERSGPIHTERPIASCPENWITDYEPPRHATPSASVLRSRTRHDLCSSFWPIGVGPVLHQ